MACTNDEAKRICTSLRFGEKELKRLQAKFDHYDADGSGEIDMDEFFLMVGEPKTTFTLGIFNCLNIKDSNLLNFDDFIICVCTFAIYTKTELLRFCFDMYDIDQSGCLNEDEFSDMCKSLHGNETFFGGNFLKAMNEFDRNKDGLVDFDEFVAINNAFSMAFYPVFRLQKSIQSRTLGEVWWAKILKEKAKLESLLRYIRARKGVLPRLTLADKIMGHWNGYLKLRADALSLYKQELETQKSNKKLLKRKKISSMKTVENNKSE